MLYWFILYEKAAAAADKTLQGGARMQRYLNFSSKGLL